MQEIDIEIRYERTSKKINDPETPTFPRSDTILLKGRVTGEKLEGLTAKSTVRMIMPNTGKPGSAVIIKEVGEGITITTLNPAVKTIDIELAQPPDTAGFEPGQQFVFDVEITRPAAEGTIALTRSVDGRFRISEDYTRNTATPSPSPTPTPTSTP